MKKIGNIVLIFIMLFILSIPAVFATGGDGNVDGGGGEMGGGTTQNVWSPGDEGVRITVVRASDHKIVTVPIDFTNKHPSEGIFNFGKVSKLHYSNGRKISPQKGGYKYSNPATAIPKIISSASGAASIEAIKSYFTDEQIIRSIANITGMKYDILIGGDYKLLIEPIIYYKFEGVMIATTATEAALYDEQLSGLLRRKMLRVTHKNLPLSMFLEVSDLGYPAWSGGRDAPQTNADIKSSLGLGVIRFTEEPEKPEISTYDYEYRVNTEVITSIMVSGGQSDPDNDTTVTFNIDGKNHTVSNIYYPDGDSQLVWVKWKTGNEPQDMEIDVCVNGQGGVENATIHVTIVDLDKNPPPNPVADDRNDDFEYADIPIRAEKDKANWVVWSPWWQENWEWESNWVSVPTGHRPSCSNTCTTRHRKSEDRGTWIDTGWWEFHCNQYSASLDADMDIYNDSKNPTATSTTFKSGYGIRQEVNSRARSNQNSAITRTPNAVSFFPEFGYETYWRLLERVESGANSQFAFYKNRYSTYGNPTHFSPIWMTDGAYEVSTYLMDVWTPVGMLSMNLTDELTVAGSLWDDWQVTPKKPK